MTMPKKFESFADIHAGLEHIIGAAELDAAPLRQLGLQLAALSTMSRNASRAHKALIDTGRMKRGEEVLLLPLAKPQPIEADAEGEPVKR